MANGFKNMVFAGGGVLGIAYLGVLDYLYQNGVMQNIQKVAGASAGAITACITSFNLPFNEVKAIADSLDYSKIPGKEELLGPKVLPPSIKKQLNKVFGNIDCLYRLTKQYGWYSSNYFYDWLRLQIDSQFDFQKKLPPYTFSDFKNTSLHKNERPFLDLYVIGTDVSSQVSSVFCYETTPDMEVAQAVRISMSMPLFFEAIKHPEAIKNPNEVIRGTNMPAIFSDGGIMYSYPINLFDSQGSPKETLGALFKSELPPEPITNLVDFINNIFRCTSLVQLHYHLSNMQDMARSIQIQTKAVSPTDFNVKVGDTTYQFLYQQGYDAARNYFSNLPTL